MITRLFIRLVSLLVPASLREQWREEWLAELAAQPRSFDRRVLGTWRDAVALRTSTTSGPRDRVFAGLLDDARSGWRQLRRHPWHSALTIGILGLGVGIVSAFVSVTYEMAYRPWPIAHVERVAFAYLAGAGGRLTSAAASEHTPGLTDVTTHPTIEAVAGFSSGGRWQMTVGAEVVERRGEMVTAAYFDVLGVPARIGRTFEASEDTESNPDMPIVISDRLWRAAFGASRDVIGQTVLVGRHPATVIGVTPPGFKGMLSVYEHTDAWMLARPYVRLKRTIGLSGTVIRLRPGRSLDQAATDLTRIVRAADQQSPFPSGRPDQVVLLRAQDLRTPARPDETRINARALSALAVVVVMVVIIAITNMTSVGLAQGLDRMGEVATRRVLGVSSFRLARQLGVEQLLLAAGGALLGVGVARLLLGLANALVPARYDVDPSFDWPTALVCLTVAVTFSLVVGLAPIRQALRFNLAPFLAGTSATVAASTGRVRRWLVVPQALLAVVLLVTAGVHARSLLSVELTDRGYTTGGVHVLAIGTALPNGNTAPAVIDLAAIMDHSRPDAGAVISQVETRLDEVTGLPAGLWAYPYLPTEALFARLNIVSTERSVAAGSPERLHYLPVQATSGAFTTLNLRVLEGRLFDARDSAASDPVAVVSASVARRLWPNDNPLGQTIRTEHDNGRGKVRSLRVIGVVNETTPVLPRFPDTPVVYTPVSQDPAPTLYALVGGHPDPDHLSEVIRMIEGTATGLKVSSVRGLDDFVSEKLQARRSAATVLVATGVLGLGLACMGIYGAVRLAVSRRRREFGIRLALGASPTALVSLVLREHSRLAAISIVMGLAGAIGALRGTAHIVQGVPTSDVAVFIAVPLLLAGVMLLACVLPARRAGTVDPVSTLKA